MLLIEGKKRSRLLLLPLELRWMIYDELLGISQFQYLPGRKTVQMAWPDFYDTKRTLDSTQKMNTTEYLDLLGPDAIRLASNILSKRSPWMVNSKTPTLLGICKQIDDEINPFVYGNTLFGLQIFCTRPDTVPTSLIGLCCSNSFAPCALDLSRIEHLVLGLHLGPDRDLESAVKDVIEPLGTFVSLKTLLLRLEINFRGSRDRGNSLIEALSAAARNVLPRSAEVEVLEVNRVVPHGLGDYMRFSAESRDGIRQWKASVGKEIARIERENEEKRKDRRNRILMTSVERYLAWKDWETCWLEGVHSMWTSLDEQSTT